MLCDRCNGEYVAYAEFESDDWYRIRCKQCGHLSIIEKKDYQGDINLEVKPTDDDAYEKAERRAIECRMEFADEIDSVVRLDGVKLGLSNTEIIGILETTKLRYFLQMQTDNATKKQALYKSTQPDNPYANMRPIQCEKCGGAMYPVGNYKDEDDTMIVFKCANCNALTNQRKIEDGDDTND